MNLAQSPSRRSGLPFRLQKRSIPLLIILGSLLGLGSCGGGGGGGGGKNAKSGGIELIEIATGRLADVYGLVPLKNGKTRIKLFQKDVLVGPDIQDQRSGNDNIADQDITYDFDGFDPDTLQPKLVITRKLGSSQFLSAFEALDKNVIRLTPGFYGQNIKTSPYSVAPRNGGIRLRFNTDLGLSEDFFLAKDSAGRVIGIKNPEAVQLLEILGDPTDSNPVGDFRLIPTRIAYHGAEIILDPVLLGSEGTLLNVPNNSSGLPQSSNSTGANIRIALTLEGPLRLRGFRESNQGPFIGTNLSNRKAIIRDFRSANEKDDSLGISHGFVRDVVPPRLIGELPMRLEQVERLNPSTQRLRIFKGGITHEIDRGDVIKLFLPGTGGKPIAQAQIIADPEEDRGKPQVQHVTVQIDNVQFFEPHDPSKRKDFPTDPKLLDSWLLLNAPTIILSTEFNGSRDRPEYFLSFSPKVPQTPGQAFEPNKNVSPFASLLLRFSKPIRLETVTSADSMILSVNPNDKEVLDPKKGIPGLIYAQVFDEDGSATTVRLTPPLGFYMDDSMRKQNRPFFLHLIGGAKGIRDFSNNPIDLQFQQKPGAPIQQNVSMSFLLDTRKNQKGNPLFPNNRVVNLVRRFLKRDEDESNSGTPDFFGAFTLLDGKMQGRPTSRHTAHADDFNQAPDPGGELSYCPIGLAAPLTASTVFLQPIQNPLSPYGCRLQTVWRELDLSLSRTDPFDFNLDVEQMWWAPFQATASAPKTSFDIFDRLTLFIGHSEHRPNPCIGAGGFSPFFSSGLVQEFFHNYARDMKPDSSSQWDKKNIEFRAPPHVAFQDKSMVFKHSDSIFEPNKKRRYLPLPTFQKPYLTWRDERLSVRGGGGGRAKVISPFKQGSWDSQTPRFSRNWRSEDGRVGSIALPLLADFWSFVDDPDLPKNNPWKATGANGWQVSITALSSPFPNFRAYSAGGFLGQNNIKTVNPASQQFARGGWNPTTKRPTRWGDNTFYWIRIAFQKRISVATSGFFDLRDPHIASKNNPGKDPRLGPYSINPGTRIQFDSITEPPPSSLPNGTKILLEYRGADSGQGISGMTFWDPAVAGDAHIRIPNLSSPNKWTYQYSDRLTEYVQDPNQLTDPNFLKKAYMQPDNFRRMNFRFIFENNVNTNPPVTPSLDTFALVYRLGS